MFPDPIPFDEVIHDELDRIAASRRERGVVSPPEREEFPDPCDRTHASHLVGLAFSGGGIRSATFNLGILQAMARLGMLRRVDYLSTVSGGGYIGSWLAAWIKRSGLDHVIDALSDSATNSASCKPADPNDPNALNRELDPIFSLRRYSNYLAPKLGFLGADTWTIGAVYIRNLLLNQLILIAALGGLLMIPRLLTDAIGPLELHGAAMVMLAAILLAAAASMIAFNLRALIAHRRSHHCVLSPVTFFQTPTGVQVSAVLPVMIGAFLMAICGEHLPFVVSAGGRVPLEPEHMLSAIFTLILLATGAQSGWDLFFRSRERKIGGAALLFIASFVPGVAGGYATYAVSRFVNTLSRWDVLVWGMPVFVVMFGLMAIVHLGLLGSRMPDEVREWWSRLGALLLIYSLGWVLLSAVAIYGPLILALGVWAAVLAVGWLWTSAAGAAAARSSMTGSTGERRSLSLLAKVAPYVFIAGLLMAISTGLQLALAPHVNVVASVLVWPLPSLEQVLAKHWEALDVPTLSLSATFLVLLLEVALIFSLTVDVNEFSMHQFYRNRLVRAYLGASRRRRPEPFTGFDPHDDMPLANLAKPEYHGPYPIINTALNLVHGDELAWQERKAASFIFTPLYSGFQFPERRRQSVGSPAPLGGFRPTPDYAYPDTGGIELGTAVAISGAAASPNMGYHTSAAASFLMTMFNVRLGWWLGNPLRGMAFRHAAPPVALYYLVKELLGKTNATTWYVYLSDGGHFENLGIYELVRRRCRCIIASDAGQDETFACDDLANAIRKCRTDLGIPIEINVDNIRGVTAGNSKWHCAVGRIQYGAVDQHATPGTLIYVKASLTGDETADVLNYAARNSAFPHQSTADQFFSESQFESYRSLGFHVGMQSFGDAARQKDRVLTLETFLMAMRERWYPASSATALSFSKHAAQVQTLLEQLRNEPNLEFLDSQIYPEWTALMRHAEVPPITELWLPKKAEQLHAGFYFCKSMIQLMESVYLDLNLDSESDHPDNRGWVNLFKHWSWSGMFRATWAIAASTYGARFQTWCARRLDLRTGTVDVIPCQPEYLNFHEQDMIEELRHTNPSLLADGELLALVNRVDDFVGSGEDLTLTFGFAIVRSGTLYFFRIQDHLRRMGLAHASLKTLIETRGVTDWDGSAIEKAGSNPKYPNTPAAQEMMAMNGPRMVREFREIFESVSRDCTVVNRRSISPAAG